jgi:hypothetical protein
MSFKELRVSTTISRKSWAKFLSKIRVERHMLGLGIVCEERPNFYEIKSGSLFSKLSRDCHSTTSVLWGKQGNFSFARGSVCRVFWDSETEGILHSIGTIHFETEVVSCLAKGNNPTLSKRLKDGNYWRETFDTDLITIPSQPVG